ncbi:MAG: 2-hydroxyglutaryl-CoA dehydratase [Bacteroidales bacterium]|nr:2-hydroxyglutaryl-CoA dehydratase [Bacteroidales bacterium]
MLTLGVDIGSLTAKGILFDGNQIVEKYLMPVGYNSKKASEKLIKALMEKAGIVDTDIKNIVATGYGRNNVEKADKAVSEIICHGKGVHFLLPHIRTIIDIGGQDSKVIVLDVSGKVSNFVMNDKCAAGTGRFLDVMARAMETEIEDFGPLALQGENPSKISSVCTVFAESEIISLVAKGEKREDITSGIHWSIARRIASMVKRLGMVTPVAMSGGVALNVGVIDTLEQILETKIETSALSQYGGALGAALMAAEL